VAEWRLWRGWPSEALRARLESIAAAPPNFAAVEEEMTRERGWRHYSSEATIVREADGSSFDRARVALANYQFSNPAIVCAHFDSATPLIARRMLLEIRVLGLRYLCPTAVVRVRDEPHVFGFRYHTLEGHIERGMEWFLLTRNDRGDIRFRIEACWREGELPNWWSRLGFLLLVGHYQRKWHTQAHERMSLLAHSGSLLRPASDRAGLTHQGVDVSFSGDVPRRWFA
jgi:uncharacterized protein (UPF0548 family)